MLLLFVMLALLAQCALVRTHLHISHERVGLATASTAASQGSVPGKVLSTAHCLLCDEAARAGAYVQPEIPVLPLASPPTLGIAPATIAAFALLVTAHDWRSRAPPR
jgi:hypothetical protein